MPAIVTRPPQVDRKRRVHAKSRKGCGNCKLRRVKCDELRPHCKKCLLYGVDCNYGGSEASLQLSAQGSFQVDLVQSAPQEQVIDFSADTAHLWIDSRSSHSDHDPLDTGASWFSNDTTVPIANSVSRPSQSQPIQAAAPGTSFWPASFLAPFSPVSINSTTANMIDSSLQFNFSAADMQPHSESAWAPPAPFWHFSEAHLEILARFRDRTALTIGVKTLAPSYRDILCELAMTHAFLMHMLLSLTLMHDSHLAHPSNPPLALQTKHASLTHWTIATKLFKNLLSKPIQSHQRDAIWATGVIVGAASLWFVNSNHTHEVWPLKPREPDDLGWLRLGDGKRALWKIAEPTRADSLFHSILSGRNAYGVTVPEWIDAPDAADLIPSVIKRIFDINHTSSIDENVYLLPLLILSKLQNTRLTHDTVMEFLHVIAFISPELIRLLEAKDSRAVFVIGWWFKQMADGDMWWLVSRARIEGEAIREWLGREGNGGVWGLRGVLDGLEPDRAALEGSES